MTPHRVIQTILRSTLLLWVCCVVLPVRAEMYTVQMTDSDTRNKLIAVDFGGRRRLFHFDTGCSSMAINSQLLRELREQGLVILSQEQTNAHTEVMMSNGETKQARSLLIKKMKIGDCEFTNVVAQVGTNDKPDAPLLLGQSILERMKTYSIQGTTLQFEPYDEDYQQALSLAEYRYNDKEYASAISNQLLPYFREGRLSCFFTYKLLFALQHTDAYADALEVLQYIREQKDRWAPSRSDIDLAEIESLLHYNSAVDDYNADRYDLALLNAGKAKQAAQAIRKPQTKQKRLHDVGTLYWYIYSQTDPQKAKAYEQYKL